MREQCGREGCCSCDAVKTNRVGPKDLDAAFAFLKRKGVRVMPEPSSSGRAIALA
jgi:cytochrome c551/c552